MRSGQSQEGDQVKFVFQRSGGLAVGILVAGVVVIAIGLGLGVTESVGSETHGVESPSPATVEPRQRLVRAGDGDAPHARQMHRSVDVPPPSGDRYELGMRSALGIGVAVDVTAAIRHLEAAAETGDARAQYELARLLLDSPDGATADDQVVRWLRAAAIQHHPQSQLLLAHHLLAPNRPAGDLREGAKWYAVAAERGDPIAQFALGVCHLRGLGVPRDDAEAGRWFLRAANRNVVAAQYNIAILSARGRGVPLDLEQADAWYRRAAGCGHIPSQYNLAVMLSETESTQAEAVSWYEAAARAGDPDAQFNLSSALAKGAGGTVDKSQWTAWLMLSAQAGCPEAQLRLATLLFSGTDLPQDTRAAVEWYERAAEARVQSAQLKLGLLLARGEGIARDSHRARLWLRAAALRGSAEACTALASLDLEGNGTHLDRASGYSWLVFASGLGDAEAAVAATELRAELDRAEVERGELLASEHRAEFERSIADHRSAPSPEVVGYGVFVSSNGYFLTNVGTVSQGARFRVFGAAGCKDAVIAARSSALGLALLRCEGAPSFVSVVDGAAVWDSVLALREIGPSAHGVEGRFVRIEGSAESVNVGKSGAIRGRGNPIVAMDGRLLALVDDDDGVCNPEKPLSRVISTRAVVRFLSAHLPPSSGPSAASLDQARLAIGVVLRIR